jgi:hypothetical protein
VLYVFDGYAEHYGTSYDDWNVRAHFHFLRSDVSFDQQLGVDEHNEISTVLFKGHEMDEHCEVLRAE